MAKKSIAVIMGGPSREHDVSLKSGAAVLSALPDDKYEVKKVLITLSNSWIIDDKEFTSSQAVQKLKDYKVELVFLALHGSFGEDGTVQALLDNYDIKYTGSGVSSSLLAMNKVIAGELFAVNGLRVPSSITLSRYELVKDPELVSGKFKLSFPVIIKPASQGSSVGVTLVTTKNDLQSAVEFALEHDNQIIAQEYIQGREVSCGVLEDKNGKPQSLSPTELKPVDADFFDYYAKYTAGATDEITPPNMPQKLIEQIQTIAINAHQLLSCKAYSRTDMIIRNNDIYVIETNTLPGLTQTSILPQQAKEAGMSFVELIERVIVSGLR